MNLIVNGDLLHFDFKDKETIDAALEQLEFKKPFSVAINGEFVARAEYSSFLLSEGDTVDVVSPIFGG